MIPRPHWFLFGSAGLLLPIVMVAAIGVGFSAAGPAAETPETWRVAPINHPGQCLSGRCPVRTTRLA